MKGWWHHCRRSAHKIQIYIVKSFVLKDWVTFYRIKWWLTPASERDKPTGGLWVGGSFQNICLLLSLLNNFLWTLNLNTRLFRWCWIYLYVCVFLKNYNSFFVNNLKLMIFCEWFKIYIINNNFSDLVSWKYPIPFHPTRLYWCSYIISIIK